MAAGTSGCNAHHEQTPDAAHHEARGDAECSVREIEIECDVSDTAKVDSAAATLPVTLPLPARRAEREHEPHSSSTEITITHNRYQRTLPESNKDWRDWLASASAIRVNVSTVCEWVVIEKLCREVKCNCHSS
jgi:hypothetical protein